MQRFKAFILAEMSKVLAAKGKDAERHTEKYIKPSLVGKKVDPTQFRSPLTLNKATPVGRGMAEPGTKLMPIAGTHKIINGIHHHDFHAIGPKGNVGIIKTLPHNRVSPETDMTGKHNDEHAVIKVWNHFAKSHKGRHPEIEQMHAELKKARSNPNHPLHVSHANPGEFAHGLNGYNGGSEDVKKKAETTYNKNMNGAAYTIHAMANHKDFQGNWKNQDEMDSTGRGRAKLSKLYAEKGVKNAGATPKADTIVIKPKSKVAQFMHKGVKMVSLKDNKGSQLMSSSPAEFHAIYQHSFNKMHQEGKITPDQHRRVTGTLQRIRSHLENGDHVKAQDMLSDIHNTHNKNGLLRAIHHEAITGEGKFATQEGTATHVATIGQGAEVHSVGSFLDHHEPWFNNPRAGQGKHGEGSTAVRLDTPTIPKTQKGQIERLQSHKEEGSGPYAMPKEARESHIKKVMSGVFAKVKTLANKFRSKGSIGPSPIAAE